MTRKAAPPPPEDNSRRAELVRTAARLFRDQGYERTTVRDLGNAVGLQSGSLFYHFRTKEEILVAVMALGITSTTEKQPAALDVATTAHDKVSALIHVHLNSLLGENQAALEVMLYEWRSVSEAQRPGLIILRDRYEALWQTALDEAAAAGVVGPGHPFAAAHAAGQPALVGAVVQARWRGFGALAAPHAQAGAWPGPTGCRLNGQPLARV